MILSVCNFKGGVGKSSLSTLLLLTLPGEYGIVTNDEYSPISTAIPNPKKRLLKIEQGDEYPDFPPDLDLVFDLGGHIDQRNVKALDQSAVVLVPVTADSYLDIQTSIDCIAEIERHNKNIIIIANRTQRKEFDQIEKAIRQFYDYPILELKRSKAIANVFIEKKSIAEMVADGGLKAYNYKTVNNQFNAIIKKIMEYR